MNRSAALLAVTPGEPAGIGPEILLKLALQRPELPLLAVADSGLLQRAAEENTLAAQLLGQVEGSLNRFVRSDFKYQPTDNFEEYWALLSAQIQ